MVAYSYKRRFVQPILDGTKVHTIRGDRKRHARPGEVMQNYWGMRTKGCFLICAPICDRVSEIYIDLAGGLVRYVYDRMVTHQRAPALDAFARRDGFECWADLKEFWRKENDATSWFKGVIIFWKPIRKESDETFL